MRKNFISKNYFLGKTKLHKAVEKNDIKAVRSLIDKEVNLDAQDNEGETPLHYAAVYDFVMIAEMLIEAGANINIRDSEGWGPLHLAAWCGNTEIVKLLRDYGAQTEINIYSAHIKPPTYYSRGKILSESNTKDSQEEIEILDKLITIT